MASDKISPGPAFIGMIIICGLCSGAGWLALKGFKDFKVSKANPKAVASDDEGFKTAINSLAAPESEALWVELVGSVESYNEGKNVVVVKSSESEKEIAVQLPAGVLPPPNGQAVGFYGLVTMPKIEVEGDELLAVPGIPILQAGAIPRKRWVTLVQMTVCGIIALLLVLPAIGSVFRFLGSFFTDPPSSGISNQFNSEYSRPPARSESRSSR